LRSRAPAALGDNLTEQLLYRLPVDAPPIPAGSLAHAHDVMQDLGARVEIKCLPW
jgi:hypothetical protein